MSGSRLRPATEADLSTVWPAVRAARVFRSEDEFVSFHAEAPWRVRVDREGSAVVVERWRDPLDILAIRGLWCRGYDTLALLRETRALAAAHGYGRLLSPLLPVDAVTPYTSVGFRPHEYLVVLRFDSRSAARVRPDPPVGVRIRAATPDDLVGVFGVDAVCFEPFWAYEIRRFAIALAEDRLIVAEESGRVVGYTLSTVDRDSGTIGRIAVSSEARGCGVGSALLQDALAALARAGAGAITLCTQEGNADAQKLYASLGGREMDGRLVLMIRAT